MTLPEALTEVLKAPDKGYTPQAKSYAKAASRLDGEALRVQIIYILSNLQYWKGGKAREVKKFLKTLIG